MTVLGLARVGAAGLACLACVFLFQLCYSVGPVYLALVIAERASHDQVVVAIVLFLILYFLPYPLTFAASCLQVLWRAKARRVFYELAFDRSFGRVAHAVRPKSQKEFAGLVSATGQDIVSDCVSFVYGTASLVFSSTLSVVLISAFVFRDFLLSYSISAVLVWIFMRRLGDWPTRRSEIAEEGYNRFVSALPGAWIANALGERSVMARFDRVFVRRWAIYRRLAMSANVSFQSLAMLQAAGIWLPTAALVLMQIRSMDTGQLLALAIVLPRLAETLLDVSNLSLNIADYRRLKGRVAWLENTLVDEPVALLDRVTASQLRLKRKSSNGWEEVDLAFAGDLIAGGGPPGRYALLGANGSGKTSFLLYLKALNPAASFYLPALDCMFPEIGQERSTGQRKIHELRRALRLIARDGRALLLDEWDANLDPRNRELISADLDDLACTRVILEVTHALRPEPGAAPDFVRT